MTKLALYWDPMRPTTSRMLCRGCADSYDPLLDVVSRTDEDDERLMRGCDDCEDREMRVRSDE